MVFTLLILLIFLPLSVFAQKYVGGDISLLAKYEANGAQYYDKDGKPCGEMLSFFKNNGYNAMRVRLFVNPENAATDEKGQGVFQNLDYVKSLGKRIKDAGMAFLLDFHYSDSWADPGKQRVPKAWEGLTDEQLASKLYDYTKDCLQQLNDCGATPDLIQTGNEISYGMLFGEWSTSKKQYYAGKADNRDRFVAFLKSGLKACREVCPQAKTIIHTERVEQPDYIAAFYDDMAAAGIDYDIIGLSYYPIYHGLLPQLQKALDKIKTRYPGKEVQIVETGYSYAWAREGTYKDKCLAQWPVSETSSAGQAKFTEDLIQLLNNYDFVTGLYWWQMDANEYGLEWGTKRVLDSWWNESLFDNRSGKATDAFYKMQDFNTSSSITSATADCATIGSETLYNISGQRVSQPVANGIYIKDGRKYLTKNE
ncbi:MAG: glycosyl hydrolase 53 family protein [Bacteroidaceae bacterium]|nr:glycosyl hydrolase 53 family protein [Bacteroidaceae bacterium]